MESFPFDAAGARVRVVAHRGDEVAQGLGDGRVERAVGDLRQQHRDAARGFDFGGVGGGGSVGRGHGFSEAREAPAT
jgi:hypothetical protein